MDKRVAVGISGGVDSAVAAVELLEQGYAVTGVHIEANSESGCRANQDKTDALKIALKLKIPFVVLDFRKEYQERVTKYFLTTYKQGLTPNPDVVCNREIKFGIFCEWAFRKIQGKPRFDYVATGHYARIAKGQAGNDKLRLRLQRGKDRKKDQSYFLWQIPLEYLERIVFPLGKMKKSKVREKARSWKLPNAEKPDSMGVCMMGQLKVNDYLKEKLGEREGKVVLSSGHSFLQSSKLCEIGRHRGLWFQTIGQRVGKGVSLQKRILKKMGIDTTKMPVLFVVGKERKKNRLIVGRREECYTKEFTVDNCQFSIGEELRQKLAEGNNLFIRIRNLGELYPVKSITPQNSKLIVETREAVFAPAGGQAAVFYTGKKRGDEFVIGGGEIRG